VSSNTSSNAQSRKQPACGCAGWTLHEYEAVTSTNLVAAALPIWNAVRADIQTAGRGRFQRSWVSDAGGLSLSAVVPVQEDQLARRALPLVVGLAVCDALQELGVEGFRLRWPNDVLVNDRKLAGLLIDQFQSDRVVIGLGLNVSNHPEDHDTSLAHCTTRLADLLPASPGLAALTDLLLRHLRSVLLRLEQETFDLLFQDINLLWGPPREVELDLDGISCRGVFRRVDQEGRLALSDPEGNLSFYDAHQVRHLTEIQLCL
jgi:BirA family biotin operon repressor/biotin-[acetyl-CoA-carboxylase] ligase